MKPMVGAPQPAPETGLFSLSDVDPTEIHRLVGRSTELFHDPDAHGHPLADTDIGVLFTKTSTRTRTAFSVGARRLGASVISYGPGDLQLNTGESVQDTGRILGAMLDGLVARTAGPLRELRELSRHGHVPVVNAMATEEHPTQGICDLATMRLHLGELTGVNVLYIGEGNNTAVALAHGLARISGSTLTLATPPGYGITEHELHTARAAGNCVGAKITPVLSMDDLPSRVDIVYTTRWQTTGTAKADPDWREVFRPFHVSEELLARWPAALFMHDLPAHRGDEVSGNVVDGKRSIAWSQAAMKLTSAMAILEWCLPRQTPFERRTGSGVSVSVTAAGRGPEEAETVAERSAMGVEEARSYGHGPRLEGRGAAPGVRIFEYCHLMPADLRPPQRPHVFFDPADTEVGIWATVDLIKPGCTVLDLGSGSGAAASAVARAGAGHVHGLDISEDSVLWASEHYALETENKRVTFGIADYALFTPSQLLDSCPFDSPPTVVTGNPPYVPVPSPAASQKVSIDGGLDGLRLVRLVVHHAAEMGSDLGITIGSYSSPRTAASLLYEFGYGISRVTLSALRLGDYTLKNMERVLKLEATGEGPLLRAEDGIVYYLIVGLSCRRIQDQDIQDQDIQDQDTVRGAAPPTLTPDGLLALLHLACKSRTLALEGLENSPATWPVPIRILVLPDEPRRHHC
jgi:ornithine carbamoyltransferase